VKRLVVLVAAVALAAPCAAAAQTALQLLTDGVAAYEDLQFTQSVQLLGRALDLRDQLSNAQQARALTYLAASQVLLQRQPDAAATFRRLLFLDPRQLPDSLQFPADVRRIYADTRERTKMVSAVLPPRSDLAVGQDTLRIRVYASSFHYLAASIEQSDGTPLRVLYSGPIRDSLALPWDARGGDGAPVKAGSYRLTLVSTFPEGQALRSLSIPLEISASAVDTLPYPAPLDSLLPERTSSAPGLRALGSGLVAGGLVLLLPPFVGATGDAGAGRFAVSGALSVAAIAGLVHGRGRPLPQNVAANDARRGAWQTARDQVERENAHRRLGNVTILAGAPVRDEASR
jgi:tetratricopeptide (TPR) repeat protein